MRPSSNTAQSGSSAANAPSALSDELTRIVNTALVSSRVSHVRNYGDELHRILETPAFRNILNAIRQHARLQGISEKQAAEQVIDTFRKLDQLWLDYVFQEGVDRLKNQGSP